MEAACAKTLYDKAPYRPESREFFKLFHDALALRGPSLTSGLLAAALAHPDNVAWLCLPMEFGIKPTHAAMAVEAAATRGEPPPPPAASVSLKSTPGRDSDEDDDDDGDGDDCCCCCGGRSSNSRSRAPSTSIMSRTRASSTAPPAAGPAEPFDQERS